MGTHNKKDYQHCQDNIVSALGKMLSVAKINYNSFGQIPIWFNWMRLLPLKLDRTENKTIQPILK